MHEIITLVGTSSQSSSNYFLIIPPGNTKVATTISIKRFILTKKTASTTTPKGQPTQKQKTTTKPSNSSKQRYNLSLIMCLPDIILELFNIKTIFLKMLLKVLLWCQMQKVMIVQCINVEEESIKISNNTKKASRISIKPLKWSSLILKFTIIEDYLLYLFPKSKKPCRTSISPFNQEPKAP